MRLVTPVALTQRDLELLDALCAFRAMPLEQVAARFFQKNPFTGAVNTSPIKACERRLATLSAAGYILKVRCDDGRRMRVLVGLGPRAGVLLGAKAQRAVPTKKLAHHARTMDALKLVEDAVRARGGRVLCSRIEQQVRSDAQRGRFLRAGDSFDPFPDAVCTAELPTASGHMRRTEIAVEYATSKYTDEDIRKKHEGFATALTGDGDDDEDHDGYDEVFWFADGTSTQERVRRATGGTCSILP